MIEPLVGHRLRSIEWEWVIKKQARPVDPGE
jgi:hypothetical protein